MLRIASLLVLASVVKTMVTLDESSCDVTICKEYEYCSVINSECTPCEETCNSTLNNYDKQICNKECQEYLLNKRFLRLLEKEREENYRSIEHLARIAIIMSSTSFAMMLLLLIYICRRRVSWKCLKQKLTHSKNRVKQYPADLTHHNPHAVITRTKPELKIDIKLPENDPQPLNARDLETRASQKSHGASTAKTASTALSNRYPAEDTTLDYSYDNRAMNITPPEQSAATHKF